MSRPWRLAVGAAQLVFAVALVAGLYLDLMMLAPRLPELGLPAIALSAPTDPNAREDRAPTARSADQAPTVEAPPPSGPPAPPPVTTVAREGRSTGSPPEVPSAVPQAVVMAAPIETISSLALVDVSPGRGRSRVAPASMNAHAIAAHERHESAPPPRGNGPRS